MEICFQSANHRLQRLTSFSGNFQIGLQRILKYEIVNFLFVLATLSSESAKAQLSDLFRGIANSKTNEFTDQTGHFQPIVKGGIVINSKYGSYLLLGEGENSITLSDNGKINFKDGVTFEARVFFEETPPTSGTSLALKPGSFSWDLVRSKLHVSWMSFPGEVVATTNSQQFKYYPVGSELINGLIEVPVNRWISISFSYDQALGSLTTTIDGLTDRKRYRYRGPQQMLCDGKSPFTFFKGFKNCRIESITLRTGRPKPASPGMEVFVNPLPYSGKLLITFDHLDPDLKLPLDVTLLTEKASGQAFILARMQLNSHDRKDTLLDLPSWKNSLHTLMVNLSSGSKAIYQRNFRIANPKPTGKIRIAPNLSMVNGATNFFPLFIYHAKPEDFGELGEMGFNVIYNNFNLVGAPPEVLLKKSLDSARKHNLLLLASANSDWGKLEPIEVAKNHPATFGWYGADEPYGDLGRLVESYNTLKMLDADLPVVVMINNYSRLQEAAMGADILGVDPYPIPNISLRMVYDATQAAVKAVGGCKPVWTTIPQYGEKNPSLNELRCMAWLAITGGANGLGVFEWDHRVPNKPGGWYTKDSLTQVSNLSTVIGELKSLEFILLSETVPIQPIQSKINPAIHVLLKEADGKLYLIVANDSREAESTVLRFENLNDAQLKNRLEDTNQHNLKIQNGSVSIQMPPLGVTVLEVLAKP